MTAEDPKTDDRREQKILFAQQYHVNRNDAVMIVAKILGDEAVENPMLAINFGNTWMFDPIVVAELERLDEQTKSAGRYEATAFKWAEQCFLRGDTKVAHDLLKLAATVAGHIKTGSAKSDGKSGDGEGHEIDLLEALADDENRRENPEQVPAKWQ